MNWDDEEYTEPKAKRAAGRPVENPFDSAESKADFVHRGQAMLARYYRPEAGSRSEFVFEGGRAMSKTQFWAIVYIYCTEQHSVHHNLQGFISAVQRHFGPSVISDRASVHKNVNMQQSLYVTFTEAFTLTGADGRAQERYRMQYRFVVRRWQGVLSSSPDISS